MKVIKLFLKLIALPIIAVIWLACFLAKAATHISCYVFGPFMLLIGIILLVFLFQKNWTSVGVCGAVELACLVVLFGTTWMIANMEDLNAVLIRFVHS